MFKTVNNLQTVSTLDIEFYPEGEHVENLVGNIKDIEVVNYNRVEGLMDTRPRSLGVLHVVLVDEDTYIRTHWW